MATNKAKARTLGMAWRQKDKVPTTGNAYVGPPGCEWRPCSGFRRRLGGTDGLMGHRHGGSAPSMGQLVLVAWPPC